MPTDFEPIRQEALAAGYAAVWTPEQVCLLEDWEPESCWTIFEVDQTHHQLHAGAMRDGAMERTRYQLLRADASIVAELRRAAGLTDHGSPLTADCSPAEQRRLEAVERFDADPAESGWLFGPPPKIGAIGL